MFTSLWPYLSGGGALLASGLTWLYRRYKKKAMQEVEATTRYSVGALRHRIASAIAPRLARQVSLRRYARVSLSTESDRLQVPIRVDVPLDIDRCYIPLRFSSAAGSSSEDAHLEFLKQSGIFLIFGEPGSGKTTLSRKLFRDTCREVISEPQIARFPVRIVLRELVWPEQEELPEEEDEKEESFRLLNSSYETARLPRIFPTNFLLEQIRSQAAAVSGVYDGGGLFDSILGGDQGPLIILDGLDEVPYTQLNRACEEITSLIRVLSHSSLLGSTVIVTARSQLAATLGRNFIDKFRSIISLKPFSPADIYEFLRRWPFAGHQPLEQRRIFDDLRSNESLLQMCTNPLILAMYVARDQQFIAEESGRSPRLSENRSDFYKQVTEELLYFRRAGQSTRERALSSRDRRKRFSFFGRLALEHISDEAQPLNSLDWSRALELLDDVYGCGIAEEAENLLQKICTETGVMGREREGESLRFFHLTICEYLASVELREGPVRRIVDLVDGLNKFYTAWFGRSRYAESLNRLEVKNSDRLDLDSGGFLRLEETLLFALVQCSRSQREQILNHFKNARLCVLGMKILAEAHEFESLHFRRLAFGEIERCGDTALGDEEDGFAESVDFLFSVLKRAEDEFPELASKSFPSMRQAFMRLALRLPRGIETLLRVALLYDAGFAAAEARSLGLAGTVLTPSQLTKSLTSPKNILGAIDEFSGADQDDRLNWALSLTEAALEHELVAHILVNFKTPCRATGEKLGWLEVSPVAGTMFSKVVAYALGYVGSFDVLTALKLYRTAYLSLVRTGWVGSSSVARKRRRVGLVGKDWVSTIEVMLNLKQDDSGSDREYKSAWHGADPRRLDDSLAISDRAKHEIHLSDITGKLVAWQPARYDRGTFLSTNYSESNVIATRRQLFRRKSLVVFRMSGNSSIMPINDMDALSQATVLQRGFFEPRYDTVIISVGLLKFWRIKRLNERLRGRAPLELTDEQREDINSAVYQMIEVAQKNRDAVRVGLEALLNDEKSAREMADASRLMDELAKRSDEISHAAGVSDELDFPAG
ncbi:NACHT domain-containing protein [Amycolatopsis sp. NPDC051061]|uniref:NACHT domain-containing protein n=1 Tax=Amycolatopsis sp. NPDC051061 TaxID=3155042 RepID=UPI00343E36DE